MHMSYVGLLSKTLFTLIVLTHTVAYELLGKKNSSVNVV